MNNIFILRANPPVGGGVEKLYDNLVLDSSREAGLARTIFALFIKLKAGNVDIFRERIKMRIS